MDVARARQEPFLEGEHRPAFPAAVVHSREMEDAVHEKPLQSPRPPSRRKLQRCGGASSGKWRCRPRRAAHGPFLAGKREHVGGRVPAPIATVELCDPLIAAEKHARPPTRRSPPPAGTGRRTAASARRHRGARYALDRRPRRPAALMRSCFMLPRPGPASGTRCACGSIPPGCGRSSCG